MSHFLLPFLLLSLAGIHQITEILLHPIISQIQGPDVFTQALVTSYNIVSTSPSFAPNNPGTAPISLSTAPTSPVTSAISSGTALKYYNTVLISC